MRRSRLQDTRARVRLAPERIATIHSGSGIGIDRCILMQAIGATTPAATAVMALALLGTVEKAVTYISLIPVMAGIVLATGFEPSFNSFGFLAAMGACCARAFKAVLQVSSAANVCNKQIKRCTENCLTPVRRSK